MLDFTDFIDANKVPQPRNSMACSGLLIPELQLFSGYLLLLKTLIPIKIKDEVFSVICITMSMNLSYPFLKTGFE